MHDALCIKSSTVQKQGNFTNDFHDRGNKVMKNSLKYERIDSLKIRHLKI